MSSYKSSLRSLDSAQTYDKSAHLDDRALAKVGREEVDVEGGRHEHHTQLRVLRQDVPQDDQQKVSKAVPLVDLIHHHLRGEGALASAHPSACLGYLTTLNSTSNLCLAERPALGTGSLGHLPLQKGDPAYMDLFCSPGLQARQGSACSSQR